MASHAERRADQDNTEGDQTPARAISSAST